MILKQLIEEVKTQQLTKESANIIVRLLEELKGKEVIEVNQ